MAAAAAVHKRVEPCLALALRKREGAPVRAPFLDWSRCTCAATPTAYQVCPASPPACQLRPVSLAAACQALCLMPPDSLS